MTEEQFALVAGFAILLVAALIVWLAPRPCKYCMQWVAPWDRSVGHYGSKRNCRTDSNLHKDCEKEHFKSQRDLKILRMRGLL